MIAFLTRLIRGSLQDLRSKELRSLLYALILSVSALSSVSFLADRMHRAFEFDARQLLASDLLLVSDHPFPDLIIEEAQNRGLTTAQTVVFPSMASGVGVSKLASLKAVSANYPLRGSLQISQASTNGSTVEIESQTGPASGVVWVDQALLNNLQLKLGDSIHIGERQFTINAVILRELDRGAGFMNFAPRLMMSLDDLGSTGLIGLGSRVTYRFLLAGNDDQISVYRQWASNYIETNKLRGMRIESLENAQPIMRKTLERAEQFLSLVALLTAMIAAVAIALTARRYMQGQVQVCAVMKCFGATRDAILKKQFITLLFLGIIAAILGSALGFLIQELLTRFLGGLLVGNLPMVSIAPLLWSILFAWILLLGFASVPLMSLANISPMGLIRKEWKINVRTTGWVIVLALFTCSVLIWVAARDLKLALWVELCFIGSIIAFSLIAYASLILLSRINIALNTSHFSFGFTLKAISRRASFAVMQITSLGIAIMAILMILLLRQDLLGTWQKTIPENTPNRFMINIQGDQKEEISKLLVEKGVSKPDFYPMVRGRLISINGRDISSVDYAEDNAKRLVDREFNLSYMNQLPFGNRIIEGEWLRGDQAQISLEAGIAKTLKLKLGDQLTFEVAGEQISAPVTSLRKLDWGSMRVNFFVIMPPAQLSALPQSWITSYYQDSTKDALDFNLSQAFPNLTLVDVSASLRQIQEILDKLSAALGLLFGFTIIAAMMVLMAAMAATQDDRYRNAALLKALGASRVTLSQISLYELLLIGTIAGLLAGIASGLATWSLGRYVLEIEFYAFTQAILMGLILGIAASLAAGYRFQRRIQAATAVECLRESY